MRLNQLDRMTMGRLMAELCAAYGKPFGAGADEMVSVYHTALSDFDTREVEAVVRHAIGSLEHFPKPAKLRAMCYAARPKRAMNHDDPSDTCRDCGSAYQWRRLPHWAVGAQDLQCDCGWRVIVRGYATEDDLAAMLGADDPFARDETRRRANIQRAA